MIDIRVTQGGYPGIGRATHGLVRALLADPGGHRLSLLFRKDKPLSPALIAEVCPPHRLLPLAAALRDPRDQLETPLRLSQVRADLYHATYYATALKPGVPTVLTLYDLIPERYPRYWSAPEALIIRWWMRSAAARADHLLAPSEATGADLRTLFRIEDTRLTVAPLAMDNWLQAGVCERPMGLGDRPFLLCVCTNKPHKNLPRLVRAYHRFVSRLPSPPDLVLAGGWDPRYPDAKDAAARLFPNERNAGPTVRFIHGPTDNELRWLYQHALAFVFPSEYEGFGLPVLEAMTAGLPVTASLTPAVAEVASDAALLFDPLSEDAIADALFRIVTDSASSALLARAGERRAAQFTWKATAARTAAAYRAVLC